MVYDKQQWMVYGFGGFHQWSMIFFFGLGFSINCLEMSRIKKHGWFMGL